jgi:hypothetical protein
MVGEDNPIKRQCQKILTTERAYVSAELAYLRYIMRDLAQEKLEECLKTLTYKELKKAIAAGVPGHCQHIAQELLRDFKKDLDAYLDKTGATASLETEVENAEEPQVSNEK